MTTPIYTVYQITNNINNKIYIGVHKTTNPNDDYLGSGKLIKLSILKNGKENFTKKILFEYDNQKDAYLKEKEIVNEKFIERDDTYNLTNGGNIPPTGFGKENNFYGKYHSNETKEKISKSRQGKCVGTNHHFFGKKLKNLSKELNYQFKGYYITPWGKFRTGKEACIDDLSISKVRKWCKNSNNIVNIHSYKQNKYLKSLKKNPIGKTYKELGFFFSRTK